MKLFLTNFFQTTLHKCWVFWYLMLFCFALIRRGLVHDLSKYSKEEEPYFRANLPLLSKTAYGSPAYKDLLDKIKPATLHHYRHNSHHPEYYQNGISEMSPMDEIEMLADWKAAGRRNQDGNIFSSIYKNAQRFRYKNLKLSAYIRDVEEAL